MAAPAITPAAGLVRATLVPARRSARRTGIVDGRVKPGHGDDDVE